MKIAGTAGTLGIALGIALAAAGGEARSIYSRADLLAGTVLERFDSFDGAGAEWTGAGETAGGALRIEAPEGAWAAAWTEGSAARFPAAVEWEARRLGGPPESEWAFLLRAAGARDAGVRVRFSGEGTVRVERYGPEGTDPLAGPAAAAGLLPSGWIRAAVRIDRGRMAVVVAGEEALTADLPAAEWAGVGLAAGPGALFAFDHAAHHGPVGRPEPGEGGGDGRRAAAGGDRAVHFDGFARDRGLWAKGAFPVSRGVLPVLPAGGEPAFDRLVLPFRDMDRIDLSFSVDGPGPADFLIGPRAEGEDFRGRIFRVAPGGETELLVRRGGRERPARTAVSPVPLRSGWNDLSILFSGGVAEIYVNGRKAARAEPLEPGFGVRAVRGAAFAVDHLILTGRAAGDTARAQKAWRAARTIAARGGARDTRVERIREMFLALPGLPGALDLLFREAALAGEVETALAAAAAPGPGGALLGEGRDHAMALLFAGRWEEARSALARLRAFAPEDPFGLENTLLLLDRLGERERLTREYRAARAGVEPLRASAHGAAAFAYLGDRLTAEAAEALAEALRVGPGRWDLEVVEADLLRARGDGRAARSRYESLLERGLPARGETAVRARLALVRFESGRFEEAARDLAALPPAEEEGAERARRILRAIATARAGEGKDEAGRPALEEARALAESTLADPPGAGDAILFDLVGRIESALALLDFQAGGGYAAYRAAERRAERFRARAASLDPRFAPRSDGSGGAGASPPPDPGRYAALLAAALPDDHPVGGFVEDPQRWSSWRAVDRRADLAEREIGEILGE